MPKKRMFLLDLPFFHLRWEKPEKNDLWASNKTRFFRPSTLQRFDFLYKYYAVPGLRKALVFTGVLFFAVGFTRALPPLHNWEIRKAYEARRERHEKYLKENPKYEEALLTAYKSLGPQN